MFKLDAADYMMSMCCDDGLREIASSGKSGSIFYLSHDDRFVIKTLKRSELKVWTLKHFQLMMYLPILCVSKPWHVNQSSCRLVNLVVCCCWFWQRYFYLSKLVEPLTFSSDSGGSSFSLLVLLYICTPYIIQIGCVFVIKDASFLSA